MFQLTERANRKKSPAACGSLSMAARAATVAMGMAFSAVHADPAYTIGARATVLADKAGGLTQFPETPITILQTTPEYHVLIATGLKTAYCKGASMSSLTATSFALAPTGGKGYDEVSTHITSTWTDPGTNDIYAVFNANDSDQVPRIPGPGIGFRGRYFTTALAKSTNGGLNFTKIGPILSIPKNSAPDPLQGDAFATVVMSPDKQYLYLYYGDMYNAYARGGVQTCVARATVASKGAPGSWFKYVDGEWKTPGIVTTIDSSTGSGAETTPVVTNTVSLYGDAMYPHVVYSAKLGAYVMVYAINVFDEIPEPDSLGQFPPVDLSGVYIAYSKDAINWVGHHQVVKAISIDYPGREVALHPTLVIDENASSATGIKATVYYGYNAKMWTGTPSTQYLVSQTVDVSGLDAAFWASGVGVISKIGRSGVADYLLRQSAAGEMLLSFKDGLASNVRLVNAQGSVVGKVSKVGQGAFRIQTGRVSGPLFLQGFNGGATFSKALMLP
jgi:hypothetical protein